MLSAILIVQLFNKLVPGGCALGWGQESMLIGPYGFKCYQMQVPRSGGPFNSAIPVDQTYAQQPACGARQCRLV